MYRSLAILALATGPAHMQYTSYSSRLESIAKHSHMLLEALHAMPTLICDPSCCPSHNYAKSTEGPLQYLHTQPSLEPSVCHLGRMLLKRHIPAAAVRRLPQDLLA